MAYQGAPNGGVTGNTNIPQWWTGTKCIKISLPTVSARFPLPFPDGRFPYYCFHQQRLLATNNHKFFTKDKFATTPIILVTADHVTSAYKHDAASLWVENATRSTFYICLRELQNYDGLHEDILVVCTNSTSVNSSSSVTLY